jgi:histidinol dehydrogenase
MMQLIDLRGADLSRTSLMDLVPRAALNIQSAIETVAPLMQAVRERGEAALLEQALKFDGVNLEQTKEQGIRVSASAIDRAVDQLPPELREAITRMIARVRQVTRDSLPRATTSSLGDGAVVEQRWEPVQRVGLYVPGGKAVYPSSVVMNVVPAQEAGVRSLAIASPAQADSQSVHPVVLGVAGLLGVTEVYAMGGAGAVAAFAHGVPSLGLDPVDMVTGPGNIFVAAAKRLVNGTVGIDAEAGTTEILILADEHADPALVAVDLISQAEHDEAAASVLVTDSEALVSAVQAEVAQRAGKTKNAKRAQQALSGTQSAIVLTDSLDDSITFTNAYGAEHLEIHTRQDVLDRVHNAGAVFIGNYSPVSLGDYMAGSNHVLPTGGTSRFQSGLGAHTFLRAQQVIRYERKALESVQREIETISTAEGLNAHGEAVDARFEGE